MEIVLVFGAIVGLTGAWRLLLKYASWRMDESINDVVKK